MILHICVLQHDPFIAHCAVISVLSRDFWTLWFQIWKNMGVKNQDIFHISIDFHWKFDDVRSSFRGHLVPKGHINSPRVTRGLDRIEGATGPTISYRGWAGPESLPNVLQLSTTFMPSCPSVVPSPARHVTGVLTLPGSSGGHEDGILWWRW